MSNKNSKLIELAGIDEVKKMQLEFEEKPFYQKNRTIYISSKYVMPFLCSALTIYTSYVFINNYIFDIVKRIEVSIFLSFSLLILLELIKRTLIDTAQKDWYVLHKFSAYQFLFLCLVFGFSFFVSFQGGAITRAQFIKETPIYLNVDSAVADKRKRLNRLENELSVIQNSMSWDNGNLTPDGRKAKASTLEQIGILSNDINVEVARVERHNEKISVEYDKKLYAKNRGFSFIVLIGDILLIISILYKNYYEYRVISEINAAVTPPYSSSEEGQNGSNLYAENKKRKREKSKHKGRNKPHKSKNNVAFRIINLETNTTSWSSEDMMQKEKTKLQMEIASHKSKGATLDNSASFKEKSERYAYLESELKKIREIRKKTA